MKSVEGRLETLEKQVNGEGITGAELYDYSGSAVVDARILKMPTKVSQGIALMPDGSRRGIHADISLLEVIMERKRRAESEEQRPEPTEADLAEREALYRNMLFLRQNGVMGFVERLHHDTAEKRGEV